MIDPYQIIESKPASLKGCLSFVSLTATSLVGVELAIDSPPSGKLVVPGTAPDISCYGPDAGEINAEIHQADLTDSLIAAIDCSEKRLQIFTQHFHPSSPASSLRLGVGSVGSGPNARTGRSWRPHVSIGLSPQGLSAEERARMIIELVMAAGQTPPEISLAGELPSLVLPPDAPYGISGLRSDLNTPTSVADPNLLTMLGMETATDVYSKAQHLLSLLKSEDAVASAFAFKATDPVQYDQLRANYARAMADQSGLVWKVKPRLTALSPAGKQALNGTSEGKDFHTLPLMEFPLEDTMHTACAIQREGQWHVVIGTNQSESIGKLRAWLSASDSGLF